jgi:cell division topological specificity factor
MSIFGWGNRSGRNDGCEPAPGSAAIARDRLTILLAHEGALGAKPDLIALLHENIMAVIRSQIAARPEQIQVSVHRDAAVTTLVIEVEIPA